MRLALYQPDIPQNTGALLRLAACLGIAVDIIEPCGFLFDDRRLRRVGLDYIRAVEMVRHVSWQAFLTARRGRVVLLSRQGITPYADFIFHPEDVLLLGRESCGVSEAVWETVDASLRIPMRPGLRSLNVAMAAAMTVGEVLRQTETFPESNGTPPGG